VTTRYFYFWCCNCPTRITVETEVPATSAYPEPEYIFAESEGVGLVRVREEVPGDDGLEVADLCPTCGSQLFDVDDLAARGLIPLNSITPETQAAWHRKKAL
jgi:hypothetical protein